MNTRFHKVIVLINASKANLLSFPLIIYSDLSFCLYTTEPKVVLIKGICFLNNNVQAKLDTRENKTPLPL